MKYWPQIPTKIPPRRLREFKGVNKLDPHSISDKYSSDSRNMSSSKAPALTVRQGTTDLGYWNGRGVLGLASWKNTEIHAIFANGTWMKWTGTTWQQLKSGLDTKAEWSFCNFKANLGGINLIGTNGVDSVMRYDGSTVKPLENAPRGLKFIDQHDNRLYGATENSVHFSGLSLADEWTLAGDPNDSSPGKIVRETNDGEDIIGLKSGAGHVTVFFPNSTHELYGTSPSDFEFIQVASDIGAINDKCIVNLGGLLYFLSETGIYVYAGGTRPKKEFSRVVQWYVDNMVKDKKSLCCMGADGRYLYVAIPMNSSSKSADTILVYDTIEQTWDVWGDFYAAHMLKVGNQLHIGDHQGRVSKIEGESDGYYVVNWYWVSKIFTGQSLSQKVRITKLYITLDKPYESSAEVYISSEPSIYDNWFWVGSIDEGRISSKTIALSPYAATWGKYFRIKIAGYGPCTIYEVSWDEIQSSVV